MAGTNYDPEQLTEGGFSDVALAPSSTTPGKLTFQWGPDGDLVFDSTGAYSVLMCVVTKKGTYRPDRGYGTRVRDVTSSANGSRLASYAREAGPQLADQISELTAHAERRAAGSWLLRLRWRAAGEQRDTALEVGA